VIRRISITDLDHLCNRINDVTGAQYGIGSFYVVSGFRGVRLVSIVSDSGRTRDVFQVGFMSRIELYARMQAFLLGFKTCKRLYEID